MKQKEIINQLLTSNSSLTYLNDMLSKVLTNTGIEKPNKEIEAMFDNGMSEVEFKLNLDELINAFTADVKMMSFYAGIDYAFALLGYDEVFNLLPASQKKEDIQR